MHAPAQAHMKQKFVQIRKIVPFLFNSKLYYWMILHLIFLTQEIIGEYSACIIFKWISYVTTFSPLHFLFIITVGHLGGHKHTPSCKYMMKHFWIVKLITNCVCVCVHMHEHACALQLCTRQLKIQYCLYKILLLYHNITVTRPRKTHQTRLLITVCQISLPQSPLG